MKSGPTLNGWIGNPLSASAANKAQVTAVLPSPLYIPAMIIPLDFEAFMVGRDAIPRAPELCVDMRRRTRWSASLPRRHAAFLLWSVLVGHASARSEYCLCLSSKLDSSSRNDSLVEVMFDFAHLGHDAGTV